MPNLLQGCNDPRSSSPKDFSYVVSNLGTNLGFAQGTVLVVNLLGPVYQVLSCDLLPDKVDRFEYLNSPLIVAQVKMRSPDDIDLGGFAVRNLALYDPTRSRQDAANGRELIEVLAHSNEPYAVRLLERIRKQLVGADEYADVCNVLALKKEEVQHAKDHIFCGLMMPYEHNPLTRATELLREDSPLHGVLNRQPDEYSKFTFMQGVVEYSGSLGGVIMAMATCLRRERPDQALLALDDFLWLTSMRSSTTELGAYGIEGQLVFMRLGNLIGHRNTTADGINSLLQHPLVEIQAQRSLDMLRALYRLDFYEDIEREQRVHSAAEGSADSQVPLT